MIKNSGTLLGKADKLQQKTEAFQVKNIEVLSKRKRRKYAKKLAARAFEKRELARLLRKDANELRESSGDEKVAKEIDTLTMKVLKESNDLLAKADEINLD